MLFVFPLIYIVSFAIAFKEVLKGNRDGLLIFMIWGMSIYITAMSVSFTFGLKDFIPFFQLFKELLIISTLVLSILDLKTRPKFHIVDHVIFLFLGYMIIYAILPIGDQGIITKLLALKGTSFFWVVYFTGRFINPKTIYVNKYFSHIIILTIAAAIVTLIEVVTQTHIQNLSGFFEYTFYVYNLDEGGDYGFSAMFNSDSGIMRFASFFTSPLEFAGATLVALAITLSLYTRDDNKFNINNISLLALAATVISIFFSFSRAPIASYCIMIYIYARITKKQLIIKTTHFIFLVCLLYITWIAIQFENNHSGLLGLILNTVDFSEPSSIGHLAQWTQGVLAIIDNPFGLGLGTSGRVASSTIGNVGGENQYIILAVQTGLISAILYLSIIIIFIRLAIKWLPKLKGKEKKICMAVLLIKIGLFLSSLTSEIESSTYLSYLNWFLSGLLISIITQPTSTQTPVYNDYRENN